MVPKHRLTPILLLLQMGLSESPLTQQLYSGSAKIN